MDHLKPLGNLKTSNDGTLVESSLNMSKCPSDSGCSFFTNKDDKHPTSAASCSISWSGLGDDLCVCVCLSVCGGGIHLLC